MSMKTDKCHCFRSRVLFVLTLLLLPFSSAFPQGGMVGSLPVGREKLSVYSIGIGHLQVLDRYVSPNVYRGPEYELAFQRQRLLTDSDKWLFNTYMKGGFSMMTERNGYGGFMSVMADVRFAGEYRWISTERFSLNAGPELFLKVGGLLNQRNSNNPAQLKLYLAGAVAGEAVYRTRLGRLPLALNWQVELPLLGYNFAPTYGLQYYEIGYLGKFGEASHLAWLGNLQDISQRVSVDVPMGSAQIRLSYSGDYYLYNMGGVRCRLFDSSFMIGFMKRVEIKHNGR